jgi:phenylpropionate dioxygenase-like ring-hydroxylating dioxygenase large terminal subunit
MNEAAPGASTSTSASGSHDQLNWFQQWYPLMVLGDLDPKRPYAVQLLGQELVVWRDGSGVWRAAQDKCPHRLAPL